MNSLWEINDSLTEEDKVQVELSCQDNVGKKGLQLRKLNNTCEKEKDVCPIEENTCEKEEDSCHIEENNCQKEEDICLIEENTCEKEEDSCHIKENTCQKEKDICQTEENTCVKKEDTFQIEENSCQIEENICQNEEYEDRVLKTEEQDLFGDMKKELTDSESELSEIEDKCERKYQELLGDELETLRSKLLMAFDDETMRERLVYAAIQWGK